MDNAKNRLNIGAPRKLLRNCDLDDYHNLIGGEENWIGVNQFWKGEQTSRNEVVHVTAKDPLVDLPYLMNTRIT